MQKKTWFAANITGGVSLAAAGFASSASDFDRWWKPELDAVTAAPKNHRIVLEKTMTSACWK